MLSDKTIESVRLRADIRDVVSDYVTLHPSGHRFKCCCPFHEEKTPSFFVDPSRNTWHSFGACGEGGDAISFIMKKENLDFIGAIRHLAGKYHIPVEETYTEFTTEQQEQDKLRDAMLITYNKVQHYFVANLHCQNDQSRYAREYACNRWGEEFVEESGIGFACDLWDGLLKYARQHAISNNLLKEMGLLCQSKDTNRLYDFFRNRIMIPIRDRYGRIIGYTARTLAVDDNTPKYLNTSNNILYQKANSIFGLHQATSTAIKEGKFYLVEGAPDVLRLQSIGILNVVASLGSEWTDDQLTQLKRYAATLCFLPDADRISLSDRYGTGIKKVMKTARRAMEQGFKVIVKEIPLGAEGQKQDPDSYCKSRPVFNDLQEEDFVMWYASKRILDAGDNTVGINIMEDIANVVALCDKEHERNLYIDNHTYCLVPGRSTWNKTVRVAVMNRTAVELRNSISSDNQDLLEKYGFQQQGHRYVSLNADGKMTFWSNFVLRPLFHIRDTLNAVRIFELTNTFGHKEIVELKPEDLTSIQRFSQRVEGLGNFIWMASSNRLTQLKIYLYENTETATRVEQLGWQQAGFYAFGNGIFADSKWYPVDEYGIVRLPEIGNQYLPSSSIIYRRDTQLYQFERSFVHHNWSNISLRDYVSKFVEVFGIITKYFNEL